MGHGVLLVISGPSGVGKSTVVSALTGRRPFHFSVSATTRPPRPGEKDGIDYRFVDRDRFTQMITDGDLLEWAEYANSLYGTPRDEVVARIMAGDDVLLDIENLGALQVKQAYPESVAVFLAPPSMDELERRLRRRGDTSDEAVARRLAVAGEQIEDARHSYDAVIVNDEVDRVVDEILSILSVHERGNHAPEHRD